MATASLTPTNAATKTGETLQERSKGKDVRLSNIVAAKAIAQAVRTSLGPRGMDKLMQLEDGTVLISNDGATILSKLKVLHPAAKMLVELATSQDSEAGDGTTSVVVLAGALLEACTSLLQKGIHPTKISSSFLKAAHYCKTCLKSGSKAVDLQDKPSLLNAVTTCLSSKVVAQDSDLLAPIAVDSVLGILDTTSTTTTTTSTNVDLTNIRMVPQVGGTVEDTQLILDGLVLHKGSTKNSGGPSQMPKAKIALLQYCLSAPKTDLDNHVVVSDYASMDRILREERKYLLQQCKLIKKSGANVVLIQKSILRDAYNELSLHFLAKMKILVVTDIERSDVPFICKTLGCTPIAHPDQLSTTTTSLSNVDSKLGHADHVGDVSMEGSGSVVVKFTGVQHKGKTTTVLLRGSNELVLAEASRSLHDAQCVVRSLVKERFLIAGGGAPEMEAARQLRQAALVHDDETMRQQQQQTLASSSSTTTSTSPTTTGMDSYCWNAFADALEAIPYTLAENAGMKPIEVVTELRKQHAEGAVGAGINVKRGIVSDMYDLKVVQPLLVTTSAIQLATECVCMILKVDDLIVVA